jgi:HD-GYP domain-containing protein (c-di-GMP phosphodiesterase class II)
MLRKITIDQLRVGMYVEQVDKDWFDIPFFRKHIASEQQIEKLRSYYVHEITIDTDRGCDLDGAGPRTALAVAEPPPDRIEIGPAKVAYTQAVAAMHEILEDSRSGRYLQEEPTREVVSEMVDSCMRNDDAMASLTKLLRHDEYTFSHCVNVTVFALTLGKALGLTRDELQIFGESVLLHDVGKMLVPPEILNKPGKLTAEEFDVMKLHVQRGVDFLRESFPHRADLAVVAQEHHERLDGSGYPLGTRGDQISRWGQISAIADVYDALTSRRCYKSELTPYKAISLIYRLSGGDFNSAYVERFIECVGIYPIGSLVRTTLQEVGLVVSIRHEDLLHPDLLLLYRNGHRLKKPKVIDLSECDSLGRHVREVEDILNPEDYGVSPAAHILEV